MPALLYRGCLVLLLALCFFPTPQLTAQTRATKASPYRRQVIHGFTLMIHVDVFENNDDQRWKRSPLDVLRLELNTIVQKLPPRTVAELRKLLVWIEWEDRSDPDLARGVVAKYYGVYGNVTLWSLGKGKHPGKANNIEVISMKNLTREHQPGVRFERCVLLHEMAHAVHHQVFGMNNSHIRSAYQQAMARGLYAQARDVYGRLRKPTYASRNEREYFAELSCAYLDRLHYHPFDAEGLQKHDPVGYRLMERTWGTRKGIDATLRARTEKEAERKLMAAEGLWITGKKPAGIKALEQVVADYPGTRAAARAQLLLDRRKDEG